MSNNKLNFDLSFLTNNLGGISKKSTSDAFEVKYQKFLELYGRDEYIKLVKTNMDLEKLVEQLEKSLNEYFHSTNTNETFFEGDKFNTLDYETIKGYYKIKDDLNEARDGLNITMNFINQLEVLNNKLINGLSPSNAENELKEKQEEFNKNLNEGKTRMITSRAIGIVILGFKKQNITSFNTEEFNKRVMEEVDRYIKTGKFSYD